MVVTVVYKKWHIMGDNRSAMNKAKVFAVPVTATIAKSKRRRMA